MIGNISWENILSQLEEGRKGKGRERRREEGGGWKGREGKKEGKE